MIPSNYIPQRGCHLVDWRTVDDTRGASAEEWIARCELAEAQIGEHAYFILFWKEVPWAEADSIPETVPIQIGSHGNVECNTGPGDRGVDPYDPEGTPVQVYVMIFCDDVRDLLDPRVGCSGGVHKEDHGRR